MSALSGLESAASTADRMRHKISVLIAWLPSLEARLGEKVEEAAKAKRYLKRYICIYIFHAWLFFFLFSVFFFF